MTASEDHLSLQVGIVGLPNVGKSTLFNTLTKMAIPAENFPFCTIEPNNVSKRRPQLASKSSELWRTITSAQLQFFGPLLTCRLHGLFAAGQGERPR